MAIMSLITDFIIYFPILLVILVLWLKYYHPQSTVRITNEFDADSILRSSTLRSRAGPNRRLVDVFGIQNSFTTVDERLHKDFVLEIKAQICMPDPQSWSKVAGQAKKLVKSIKARSKNVEDLGSLERLVQNYVFRMVVGHFYEEVPEMSDAHVDFFVVSINDLWNASKLSVSSPRFAAVPQAKDELLRRLTLVFGLSPPLNPLGDGRNPLNKLLPAYETMWRVVLRCFIEVRFRPAANSVLHEVLISFFDKPTQGQFEIATNERVSAKAIVLETLRLYPPTRRIHRFTEPKNMRWSLRRLVNFDAGVSHEKILHAIDVEHIQRDPLMWGEDSFYFNPARIKHMRKLAFMPFGNGPFGCPAGNSFAPMMIGICVGALMDGFQEMGPNEEKKWKLVDWNNLEVDFGGHLGPLNNDREGLPDWRLVQMDV